MTDNVYNWLCNIDNDLMVGETTYLSKKLDNFRSGEKRKDQKRLWEFDDWNILW